MWRGVYGKLKAIEIRYSSQQRAGGLALFQSSSVTMRQMAFIAGRAAWLQAVFHFQ